MRASRSAVIHFGCSMIMRYMSTTHSAPSGPFLRSTGRNQLSADAKNSDFCSLGARNAGERRPQRLENSPRDQVMHRLAHEGVARGTRLPSRSSR